MDRIKYLLLRFLREEATPAEQAELDAWAAQAPANRALMEELQDPAQVSEALANLDSLHRTEAWERVSGHADAHRPAAVVAMETDRSLRRRRIVRWSSAAAAVLIIAGVGIVLPWARRNHGPATVVTTVVAHDALPGGNRAILTLSGGKTIVLDSAANGLLAEQGSTNVQKLKNGEISYVPAAAKGAEAVTYNTLTTPRGGQYQLTLPDGTRVWLNAQSSITYPTAFNGSDRKVSITGEAYFEIAKNAHQPFSVEEKGMMIAVLGTSFNVNGYDDEEYSTTTLVEGKVEVNYGRVSAILEPDMQSRVFRGPNPGNQLPAIKVGAANVAQALAWKNGLFAFSDADLPTVMRQLSRWYNVDVKYEGEIPKDKYQFNGKIGKTLTLDQVLKILTKTQVHYSIDGNELTIRP
jgi:transmembrane sensor